MAARWFKASLCILVVLAIGGSAMGDVRVRARDFGAIPGDGASDTEGLRAALKQVIDNGGGTLVLEPGRYLLQGPDAPCRMLLSNCENITIEGNSAELLGSGLTSIFTLDGARNITFHGLSIDWSPLPYSAGTVVARGDLSFDLEVLPLHEAKAGLKVGAILGMDRERRRLAVRGLDVYQTDFDKRAELVRPGVMRCFVSNAGALPAVGDFVVVRHQVYGIQAFNLRRCENIRFVDVTVYCCPGMGIYAGDTTNVLLDRFRVMFRPGEDRWMTATADATHFNYCRGMIVMQDCLFEGMGDDASNIHNMQFVLDEKLDDRTVRLAAGRRGWPVEGLRVGDQLDFCGGPNRLMPYVTLAIESLDLAADKQSATVRLAAPLPSVAANGDVVGNSSALPAARITDSTFRRNRARGMLLQSRDIIVDRCTFEDISGAALHLTCDADYWWEGMGTRDVTIRNSHFARCNFGTARQWALIDIFGQLGAAGIAGPGANQRIAIYGNEINDVAEGAAISIGSASDVAVHDNRISGVPDAAIVVRQSRDVVIRDNVFTNTKDAVRFADGVDPATVTIEGNEGP
jgi:hypothetical protein